MRLFLLVNPSISHLLFFSGSFLLFLYRHIGSNDLLPRVRMFLSTLFLDIFCSSFHISLNLINLIISNYQQFVKPQFTPKSYRFIFRQVNYDRFVGLLAPLRFHNSYGGYLSLVFFLGLFIHISLIDRSISSLGDIVK